jgi:rhodanese-related sulfurtransferase
MSLSTPSTTNRKDTIMKTITTQDLQKKINTDLGLHLWNVTSEPYFKGEMIAGSRYIPVDKLEQALASASLPKDAQIVVYCGGPQCPASKMAAEKLESLGYKNVEKYVGGIEEWKGAGLSIAEQCDAAACSTGACETTPVEKKQACGSC